MEAAQVPGDKQKIRQDYHPHTLHLIYTLHLTPYTLHLTPQTTQQPLHMLGGEDWADQVFLFKHFSLSGCNMWESVY